MLESQSPRCCLEKLRHCLVLSLWLRVVAVLSGLGESRVCLYSLISVTGLCVEPPTPAKPQAVYKGTESNAYSQTWQDPACASIVTVCSLPLGDTWAQGGLRGDMPPPSPAPGTLCFQWCGVLGYKQRA